MYSSRALRAHSVLYTWNSSLQRILCCSCLGAKLKNLDSHPPPSFHRSLLNSSLHREVWERIRGEHRYLRQAQASGRGSQTACSLSIATFSGCSLTIFYVFRGDGEMMPYSLYTEVNSYTLPPLAKIKYAKKMLFSRVLVFFSCLVCGFLSSRLTP